MAGRQSHGGPPVKKVKPRTNPQKKALDAYSTASHQNPDRIKVRHNRLGATEGPPRPNKRHRDNTEGDDDDEEAEQSTKKQKKGPQKGRLDELDVDEGSDSEGNEWKLGQVDSDDDSDIDSDDAFGESDEEKFDGYAFSGSTQKKGIKAPSRRKDLNLDEDDLDEPSDIDSEDDDLGDDAMDLAAMLDATEEDETVGGAEGKEPSEGSGFESEESGNTGSESELESEDSGDESSSSSFEDVSNPAKLAALQNMVAELPQKDRSKGKMERDSDGMGGMMKLTMNDILGIAGPEKKLSKDKKQKALDIPLEKRQQARLDRGAAYEQTKETLGRWTDTVKHNRRADHLVFPLPDADTAQVKQNNKLLPTNLSKPFSELEAMIQKINEESGLVNNKGQHDAEKKIQEFEELEMKKLSLEEVQARRGQLRLARELLMREERNGHRINKIKSKAYRRVHRKQREKEERLNKEALAEGGFEPSEDELDAQDRRRAEERMGQKHRNSRWAKATKESGRAAWDEDARAGITDLARRDEELRKRVEGRGMRKEFQGGSDRSLSDSSEDDDSEGENDDATEQKRLLKKLQSLGRADPSEASGPGSKLANLKFMRRAEEARKKNNDALVEEIRRDLAGEGPPSEDEDLDIGRRTFGPGQATTTTTKPNRNEFEEPDDSEDENNESTTPRVSEVVEKLPFTKEKRGKSFQPSISKSLPVQDSEGGAWSRAAPKPSSINQAEASRRRHKSNNAIEVEELDLSQAAMIATQPKAKPKKAAQDDSVLEVSDESDDDNAIKLPFALRDQDLIKRAFAGADVVGEFEAEKRQTIFDDEEKVVDNTLPGWGSWIGDGVSKREKAKSKGRVLTKVAGVKEEKRKDAKLARVIISEKRVKKNEKYLAPTLPHIFESKQQYERSLRMPIGTEWATKETLQENVKPRILLKQGIITPMRKPLL